MEIVLVTQTKFTFSSMLSSSGFLFDFIDAISFKINFYSYIFVYSFNLSLKVSKSRKQFMVSSILPKNKRKHEKIRGSVGWFFWAGKFAWGVLAKHCWALSTNVWKQKVCWHQPAMFCLITSSKLSHQ